MIVNNTPVEKYQVKGKTVFVKREDLSCLAPCPPLAKLRGVIKRLEALKEQGITTVGVLDTRISKSGWGVAALAKDFGFKVINFYPKRKLDQKLEEPQRKALELGVELIPLKAGRLAVVYYQAKQIMKERVGYMMPMGLVVEESVKAVAEEASKLAPDLLGGDVVVSVGSGMTIAGIATAIAHKVNKIVGVSAGMSHKKQLKRIREVTGKDLPGNVGLVMAKETDYYTPDLIQVPFPCSKYYDAKAWAWMVEHIDELGDKILFWNIGV